MTAGTGGNFAALLRDYLRRERLTQGELAARLGVHYASVQQVMQGRRPGPAFAIRVANLLGENVCTVLRLAGIYPAGEPVRCVLPCAVDARGEELGRWVAATLQEGGWRDEAEIRRLVHLLARYPASGRQGLLAFLALTAPAWPAAEP